MSINVFGGPASQTAFLSDNNLELCGGYQVELLTEFAWLEFAVTDDVLNIEIES